MVALHLLLRHSAGEDACIALLDHCVVYVPGENRQSDQSRLPAVEGAGDRHNISWQDPGNRGGKPHGQPRSDHQRCTPQ
jgi:hypothetical protein